VSEVGELHAGGCDLHAHAHCERHAEEGHVDEAEQRGAADEQHVDDEREHNRQQAPGAHGSEARQAMNRHMHAKKVTGVRRYKEREPGARCERRRRH
jgi:hypothetical protein